MGQLKLRDAQASDKRAVCRFTRRTWGEHGDFIASVWNDWLADRSGRFIVAELDGAPVGIAKINYFGDGEYWLEGLRVAPEHRGKGIARAINQEIRASLARMRPRAVRYCTGYRNLASRHIGSVFGFKVGARFRHFWMKSRKGPIQGEFARKRDTDEILAFMKRSRFLRLSSGLVAEGWIFRELTRSLLEAYIRKRSVVVLRRGGKLAGVAVYPYDPSDKDLNMGFIDGEPAAIKALAANCPRIGAMRGTEYCSMSVPTRHFARLMAAAGFKRESSMGQLVFELADPRSLTASRRGRLR
ncbi:MAG TPA: GNAT family N-acetyltransferase [bacterium]|nr:GNAT family N-acetyltransferase [bacterium]